jgi:hypothetical protein
MTSTHSDFFQRQIDRAFSTGQTIPSKTSCPKEKKRKTRKWLTFLVGLSPAEPLIRLTTNVRPVQKWLTVFILSHCSVGLNHRYLKESRLLKFYVPVTSAAFSKGIFAAATNSTNPTIDIYEI